VVDGAAAEGVVALGPVDGDPGQPVVDLVDDVFHVVRHWRHPTPSPASWAPPCGSSRRSTRTATRPAVSPWAGSAPTPIRPFPSRIPSARLPAARGRWPTTTAA